ncbi:MAG: hypothetical protein JXR12_06700 [Neptunomonas phycophila]|uniref:hypothetical protein n=1 Tax=Neptunomonas phycophila TaxID=1572645 RepID=UPI003B8E1A3B
MALVTKAKMIASLNDQRPGFKERYIGKALVAIFNFQTEDEKSANSTDNHNNIGFSGSDAKDGSITAKYFLKHGTLLDWMVDNWMKDFRGSPRITKYARQLNIVAEAKAAKAAKAEKVKPRYDHDGTEHDKCVFLGHDAQYDVWFHIKWGEVVLRFGDEPQENRAMCLGDARNAKAYANAVEMVRKYIQDPS